MMFSILRRKVARIGPEGADTLPDRRLAGAVSE